MRLRVFNAPTVADAMRKVRAELGDEAIIVSTHRARAGEGVEITAALEEPREAPESHAEAPRAPGAIAPETAEAAERIARALSYHGIDARLIERLSIGVLAGEGEAETLLARALAGVLRFRATSTLDQGPVMLIGPPGAGKTVTAAKLLARDVLAGFRTQAITCDAARAGGIEQLSAFTRILNVELISADGPAELARAVAPIEGRAVIDMPGANPYDAEEMQSLAASISVARAEPVLVLPAGGDAREAAEIASIFAGIGARRMIVTRLDAARRLGSLVCAADAAGLAIADASLTPYVGEGLHPLTPAVLARLLLRDPNRPNDRTAFVGSAT